MDQNTNDKQFWIDYQIQHHVFQEASLFNIVTEYGTKIYNKLTDRTLLPGGEVYVREIITSAHLCYCLEVFQMDFLTFFQLFL